MRIWEHLQERRFDRRDTVVALGGGSVSDLAGFAASTYLRGLNLVLVPTSLLGQVDAAIGGKNAINLSSGKNLAGTFFFPKAVLADQELLSTLPQPQMVSGMGEVIKYGLIEETIAKNTDYERGPKPLLDVIEEVVADSFEWDDPAISGIITSCIKMKLFAVGRDPQETTGLRRALNLGHTLGHAIEAVESYKVSHGEAVSIGLAFDMRLANSKKMISKSDMERVVTMLKAAGLPTEMPKEISKDKLVQAMTQDKKRDGDSIRWVLPSGKLGSVDYDLAIPLSEISKVL
jgi:3-dehydroquinate synthase